MVDYSIIFNDRKDLTQTERECVEGFFDGEKHRENQPCEFGAFASANPEKGVWEMPWIVERWGQQDNDELGFVDGDSD